MPDGIEIKITGIDEVNRSLYRYSQQLGDKVVIASLRNGAKLVQKAAKNRAPKNTGLLRRSIIVRNSKKYKKTRTPGKLGVYLTINSKKAFYGRFLEDGWNTHGKRVQRRQLRSAIGSRTSRKTLPGKTNVSGMRFIKGAWASYRSQAVRLIIKSVERGEEIVRRKTKGIR